MIGNSHTFYNSLPTTIQAFRNGVVRTTAITQPGATLQQHLDNPATVAAIKAGPGGGRPWSWVVLQPQSLEMLIDPESFQSAGIGLADAARDGTYGPAKVLLYWVWARGYPWDLYPFDLAFLGATPEEMTAKMRVQYDALAVAAKAKLAPVGPLSLAGGSRQFYDRTDWNHGTPVMSYLAALVLWKSMTERSVCGLPPITGAPAPSGQQPWAPGQSGLVVTQCAAHALQRHVECAPKPRRITVAAAGNYPRQSDVRFNEDHCD